MNSEFNNEITRAENQNPRILRNTSFLLIGLFVSGLIIRIFYTPFELPLTQDALDYFWYANDVSIIGELPRGYNVGNNGWPLFMSVFFSMTSSENFLDYMILQRSLSIIISCLTIPIVFLICKKFFNEKLSLVGAAIFAFEPRIIENSLLGVTEPLYILFAALSVFLILSKKNEFIFLAFICAGIATIVRVEGIFILIGISTWYFLNHKKNNKLILKYLLCLFLFILVVAPMSVLRTDVTGYDSLTSKISNSQNEIERGSSSIGIYNWISEGIVNFVKMLGWAAIPSFVLILPIGFFLMWKNREPTKISITALIVIFAIPAFYGYSVKAFDTRYLFLLYPIFCIISLYPIKKIYDRVSKKDLLLILSTSCIVLASIGFFEYQNEESQREFEAYQLSFIVAEKTKIINQYIPESGYLPIVGLTEIEEFPILRNQFNDSNDISKCLDPRKCNGLIPITNVSLEEFIKNNKESGLTHIIVDDSEHFLYRVQFLKNVFENENEFPYLIKEFDSQEEGFTYHMKIFRIDYNIFENVYDS